MRARNGFREAARSGITEFPAIAFLVIGHKDPGGALMAQGFFQEALDTDWCCPMAHGGQGKGGSKCFHVDSAYAALPI